MIKSSFIISSIKAFLMVSLFLLAACDSKGLKQEYYKDGKIKIVAETLNGELNGKLTEYYKNGVVKNTSYYKSGVLHGESKWYDQYGNIESIQNIVDGKMTGEATMFYPNGNTKSVMQYWDSKTHGTFVKYYRNGKKKIEGTMHWGKPVGEITSYDSLGNLLSTCIYDSLGVKKECQYPK